MTLVVLVTIFLGLIIIFFLKPEYNSKNLGAFFVDDVEDCLEEDFSELFEEVEEQEDIDANFINEEIYNHVIRKRGVLLWRIKKEL